MEVTELIASSQAIRVALWKILAWAALFVGLGLAFFYVDRDFAGVLGGIAVLVAFPATILSCIDASRVIKRAAPTSKQVRILGFALGLPQAVLGVILLTYGAIYPFFGISEMVSDLATGRPSIVPFVRTVAAFFCFSVGYYYAREGLGIDRNKRKP